MPATAENILNRFLLSAHGSHRVHDAHAARLRGSGLTAAGRKGFMDK